jgi:hypothetical protein
MIFDLDPTNRLLSSLVGVVVGWCGFLDENLSSCKDLVMPAFWVGVVKFLRAIPWVVANDSG